MAPHMYVVLAYSSGLGHTLLGPTFFLLNRLRISVHCLQYIRSAKYTTQIATIVWVGPCQTTSRSCTVADLAPGHGAAQACATLRDWWMAARGRPDFSSVERQLCWSLTKGTTSVTQYRGIFSCNLSQRPACHRSSAGRCGSYLELKPSSNPIQYRTYPPAHRIPFHSLRVVPEHELGQHPAEKEKRNAK